MLGDVFYFPAGMWHRVECMEDSISCNISLVGYSYADIVGDAVKHLLLKNDAFRATIAQAFTIDDARKQLSSIWNQLPAMLGSLTVPDVLPKSIMLPRIKTIVLSEMDSYSNMLNELTEPTTVLQFNPVASFIAIDSDFAQHAEDANDPVMLPGEDAHLFGDEKEEEHDSHDDDNNDDDDTEMSNSTSNNDEPEVVEKYVLHINFGNEDANSWVRVAFLVPIPMLHIVEFVRKQQPKKQLQVAQVLELANDMVTSKQILQLLNILVFNGLLKK